MMCGHALTLLALTIQTCLVFVASQCPIDESGYAKWSDPNTWIDQFENGDVPDNATITINKPVLLDVENFKEVFSITIEGPNGVLLFSNNIDISFRVHYILVRDSGSLIIGTEECKHTANVEITLVGQQDDYEIPGFNEKFIGAAAGGTIEIHGKYKLPWTKLTKTVYKSGKEDGVIYRATEDPDFNLDKPFILYAFDKTSGLPVEYKEVQPNPNSDGKFTTMVKRLERFLSNTEDGKVIAMSLKQPLDKINRTTKMSDIVMRFTGTDKVTQIMEGGVYSALLVKGDTSSTVEVIQPVLATAEATMSFMQEKRRFRVITKKALNDNLDHFEIESTDTDFGEQIINLQNDASTWETGDKIIITSTDYEWDQAEECTIVDCDVCTPFQVRVSCFPRFTHFADICDNVDMVDMRAEVGLLTRNIKIMGETDGLFGGHIKMLKGFKNAHFEGIELTRMGQNTALGRYPIHFHMCEDVGPDTYEKPSYIRGNSIHHTFARGTTIHGTHGCMIHYNFVYDTLGHALFLEDGGEKYNVFEWNLVGGQRKTNIIMADKDPSSFWITNPKTYVRNNIAFGSQSVGFWYVYPDLPIGPSRDKGFMEYEEAKHTAIYQFDNNVAHSNRKAGLFIDNILFEQSNVHSYNVYSPWENPMNRSYGPKEVFLRKFTGFKNIHQNVWNRGSTMTLEYCSLVDTDLSATLMRDLGGVSYAQIMQKCVVIGESCNVGTSQINREDLIGFNFNKGPAQLFDTYFDNFTDTSLYTVRAIGVVARDGFTSTTQHKSSGLLFGFDDGPGLGRRLFNKQYSASPDRIGSIYDEDGSLGGVPNSTLVLNKDFLLTPDCKIRPYWRMASCPRMYAEFEIKDSGDNLDFHIARDDNPTAVHISFDSRTLWSNVHVIPGGTFSYILSYPAGIPSSVRIKGSGITKSLWVRVGICIPRYDATFNLKGTFMPTKLDSISDFVEVNTVEEVDNDESGSSYMYDADVGVVFVKVIHKYERTDHYLDSRECPQSECMELRIQPLTGNMSDTTCFDRAYPKYQKYLQFDTATPYPEVIPASASSPPADWGAGMFPAVPSPPYT